LIIRYEHFIYLSTPLTVPRDYRVFIEVEFLRKSFCVADFNPYCADVIEEKMT